MRSNRQRAQVEAAGGGIPETYAAANLPTTPTPAAGAANVPAPQPGTPSGPAPCRRHSQDLLPRSRWRGLSCPQ